MKEKVCRKCGNALPEGYKGRLCDDCRSQRLSRYGFAGELIKELGSRLGEFIVYGKKGKR